MSADTPLFMELGEAVEFVQAREPRSFLVTGRDGSGAAVYLVVTPEETFGCGYEAFGSGDSPRQAWCDAAQALS